MTGRLGEAPCGIVPRSTTSDGSIALAALAQLSVPISVDQQGRRSRCTLELPNPERQAPRGDAAANCRSVLRPNWVLKQLRRVLPALARMCQGGSPMTDPRFDSDLATAIELGDDGELTAALAAFDRLVGNYPNEMQARFERAMVLLNL